MEVIHRLLYQNLDVVYVLYGLAFITLGVVVLVQPKKGSDFEIAGILWLLAGFGITHGMNELLDVLALMKGRNLPLDITRTLILAVSYVFLLEFGRRLFRLSTTGVSRWQKKIASLLVWWYLPAAVIVIAVTGIGAADFWQTGSIWIRYLLAFPGGMLIGFGFRSYFYHEKIRLQPLGVKKFFLFGGMSFLVYGILAGVFVTPGNFFPANWLNTNTFLMKVTIPVQVFRMFCAVTATWAIGGMLTIFNWEIWQKLQSAQIVLKQQLRKSEERYMEVVESSSDIIYSIDTDGYIISSNRQGFRLLDYTQPELIGRRFQEICSPETFAEFEKGLEKIRREGSVFLGEGQIIKKDGKPLTIASHAVGMYDNKRHFLGVRLTMRDISEQKKMEQELQKIEKLESVGIMAGGIAHDFNNILTAIAGNISLARVSVDKDEKLSQILAEAQKACIHAKNLTSQLLTFSVGGSPIKKISDIKELVRDSANLALRGSNVIADLEIADDLWPAEIDEGQIVQVIHNLVLNAQQAMPEGGTVEIKAENVSAAHDGESGEGENCVLITVKDQGTGIASENLARIFDPFFTTKEDGSGLGLACVYSIVKNHDGSINVDSLPGKGTTFQVYLPASDKPKQIIEKKEDVTHHGTGHILVMDDEETVRNSLKKMLTYLGYEVETARNGDEAIALYRKAQHESGHPFDAAIMDLTIKGGMGGKEAMEKLLEIDPDVKAIVSSGYFNDPIMANFRDFGFTAVIPKPYEIETLSELLHTVLLRKY